MVQWPNLAIQYSINSHPERASPKCWWNAFLITSPSNEVRGYELGNARSNRVDGRVRRVPQSIWKSAMVVRDFNWSVKPLFVALGFLGIYVEDQSSPSSRRILIGVWAVLSLLASLTFEVALMLKVNFPFGYVMSMDYVLLKWRQRDLKCQF